MLSYHHCINLANLIKAMVYKCLMSDNFNKLGKLALDKSKFCQILVDKNKDNPTKSKKMQLLNSLTKNLNTTY